MFSKKIFYKSVIFSCHVIEQFKSLQKKTKKFISSEAARKGKIKNSTHASKASNSLRSDKLAEKTHVSKAIVNHKNPSEAVKKTWFF